MLFKNTSLYILALALALAGCGRDSQELSLDRPIDGQNILNGTVVTGRNTEAARSLVVIERVLEKGYTVFQCTATLIGENTILTASHCFNPKLTGPISGFNIVFTDDYRHADRKKVRRGFKFIQHPEYLKAFKNKGVHNVADIAVATFFGDIPEGYQPVAIDSDTEADFSGQVVYAYGYGRGVDYTGKKNEDRSFSRDVLRRGVMTINNDYKSNGPGFWTSQEKDESKLCQGDSGGPIFYHNDGVLKQIGVNSASTGPVLKNGARSCADRSFATKVSYFYSWIKKNQNQFIQQMNE